MRAEYSPLSLNDGKSSTMGSSNCTNCLLLVACVCLVLLTLMGIAAAVLLTVYVLPYARNGGGVGNMIDKYSLVADLIIAANITTVSVDVQRFYQEVMLVLGYIEKNVNTTQLAQVLSENGQEALTLTKKVLFNAYSLCKVTHELDYDKACANAQDGNGE